MKSTYQDIESSFKKIDKKIDPLIVNKLNDFMTGLDVLNKRILNKGENNFSRFSIHHAIATEKRIISKLINRIKIKKKEDNPKVVDDFLKITPEMSKLHLNLEELKKQIKINTNFLLDLSSQLQRKAIQFNLYPSEKEIFENINRKVIKRTFEDFAKRVGDIIEAR